MGQFPLGRQTELFRLLELKLPYSSLAMYVLRALQKELSSVCSHWVQGFCLFVYLVGWVYNLLILTVDSCRAKNLIPTATNQSRVLNKHHYQYSYFLGFPPLSWCLMSLTFPHYLFIVLSSLVSHWLEVTVVPALGIFLPC